MLPYFPLANGLLTGKYASGEAPPGARLSLTRRHLLEDAVSPPLKAYSEFVRARDVSEVTVAIGWLLAQEPVSSVIAGATSPEQLHANAGSASWVPTPEDLAQLDAIFPAARPHLPLLNAEWGPPTRETGPGTREWGLRAVRRERTPLERGKPPLGGGGPPLAGGKPRLGVGGNRRVDRRCARIA